MAEASNGYSQRLSPRVTESDAEPLVPAVCITLEDDTYMSSEEVGVEFEPLVSIQSKHGSPNVNIRF